ncbi:hypothetical protein PsorP6_017119 [Peronosclerospora sorghi]|uniref:Uncharacterized protein n=1 Tax=Peronosclerospora sorghi TaxID=230839 RepID=A0ACC0WFJ4_9STRA|nr:hypothetical protein PsorP6_017119 [Peronosclerospora sorghi]
MKLQSTTMVAAAAVLLSSTTLADRSTEPSRSLLTHHNENHSKRLLRSGTEGTDDEERMRKTLLRLLNRDDEAGPSDASSFLTTLTADKAADFQRIKELDAKLKEQAEKALENKSKVLDAYYKKKDLKEVLKAGSFGKFREQVQKKAGITSDAAHKITLRDFANFLMKLYKDEPGKLNAIVDGADTSDETVRNVVALIRIPAE